MDDIRWIKWAKKRLELGSFDDKILLSFVDEEQYALFHRTIGRNKYTIEHTLTDPQQGRFHVWIKKH